MEGAWLQQRGLYVPSSYALNDVARRMVGPIGIGGTAIPAGHKVVAETMPRLAVASQNFQITGGTLFVGMVAMPAGQTVTYLGGISGSQAAVGTTHLWWALLDNNFNVLATTSDLAAWGAFGIQAAPITGGSFVTTYSGAYYVAVNWTGTTAPSIIGQTIVVAGAIVPYMFGDSSTPLTNPASLASPATTPTGRQNNAVYMFACGPA